MIAVTTSREWVAAPPYEAIRGKQRWLYEMAYAHLHLPEADLTETVVAVVEPTSIDATNAASHVLAWTLTGFAEVPEVRSLVPPSIPRGIEPGESILWPSDPESGNVAWFRLGVGHEAIRLPHGKPGGLALRLEPTGCPFGECETSLREHGIECNWCNRIGEPVTVVDLVGEIGRWER